MLSFERLKELKSWVSDLRKFGVSEGNEIIVLIDEAIARQSATSEDTHLCNDCEYGCMAACPITKNVKFGNGLGNDNVIECENYINKEALKKWRINQIILRGRIER